MTMFKSIPVNQMKDANLYATTRNSSDCCLVYSARGFLCAWKVRLLTSKLDNCIEVDSHEAHISTASCLNNPGERNDVLVVSVRVQNV